MKIRNALSISSFFIFAAIAPMAIAASTGNNFLIADVTVEGSDAARIYVTDSTMSGSPPSCGATRPKHFAFSLSTAKGRAMYDLAIAAMLSGKRVSVTGTNSCTVLSHVQTLDIFTLWR